jgi:hypothetical protein
MIQKEGARICTYMWSEVRSVQNRVKGPMAGRKYVLGSGNGVRSQKQSPESGDKWRQIPEFRRGQNPLTITFSG